MIKRGDVFEIQLDKKKRPGLICSYDILNENTTHVIVAPIALNIAVVYCFEYVIKDYGKVMCDQIYTLDKSKLGQKIFSLTLQDMKQINTILKTILGVV